MKPIIESIEFWQYHVENFKTSGISRKQYSNENDINYDRLGYWVKQLSSGSASFVPVKLKMPVPDASSALRVLCTLELRGHCLKIHDLSALTHILESLK